MDNNLSVIIPCAGMGRRMKSYGPKALISLHNNETVIGRQIRLLRTIHPNAEIIVVVGFEGEKIHKELSKDIKVVYNDKYEETNVARSICLGLASSQRDMVLIIYGDLVFNLSTIVFHCGGSSRILIDTNGMFGRGEVGVTVIDEYVSRFSYGLSTKWTQIVYLIGNELNIIKRIISNNRVNKLFGFEILNYVLDDGGKLGIIEPKGMQIAEIDSSKDIETARRIAML